MTATLIAEQLEPVSSRRQARLERQRRARRMGVVGVTSVVALAVVALGISQTATPGPLAGALGASLVLATFHSSILAWRTLVGALGAVVLLVPMRRYGLPIDLPYQLEPYRILVLLLVGAVFVSLLVDPELRLRRLGFGGWFGSYAVVAVVSLAPNYSAIAAAGSETRVLGALAGLLTVLAAFAVVRLVLVGRREVHALLGAIAVGGAIVGLLSIVERRTGENLLRWLDHVFPLARDDQPLSEIGGALRFGRHRAFGSAQHPVALGAQLVVVVPIGAYLAKHAGWPANPQSRTRFWLSCSALAGAGIAMSVSRLAVVALAAVVVCAVRLRPESINTGLKLAVPVLCAMLLFGGGAIADLFDAFNPSGGLIAEQSVEKSARSSGRLADIRRIGDALAEAPLLGKGSGVRSAGSDDSDRLILDNEYFGRLVDTGVLGFACFVGLVTAPIRRTWRLARRSAVDPEVADLASALACCFVGFAVGLVFYDGLSFLQPIMTFALLLAVAGWLLHDVVQPAPPDPAQRSEPPGGAVNPRRHRDRSRQGSRQLAEPARPRRPATAASPARSAVPATSVATP